MYFLPGTENPKALLIHKSLSQLWDLTTSLPHQPQVPCTGSFPKFSLYSPIKDDSPGARALPRQQQSCFPQQCSALEGSLTLFVPGFQAGNTVAWRSRPVFSKGAESVPQAPVPGVHSPGRPGSPSLVPLGGKFRGVGRQILLPLFGASQCPGEGRPRRPTGGSSRAAAGGTGAPFGNPTLTLDREVFQKAEDCPKTNPDLYNITGFVCWGVSRYYSAALSEQAWRQSHQWDYICSCCWEVLLFAQHSLRCKMST